MSTHSPFSHAGIGFPLSISRFLCVYIFGTFSLIVQPSPLLCTAVQLSVTVCVFFVCINCANMIICYPFRLHSFFVQSPTGCNSNEKTFHTRTIENCIVNCLYVQRERGRTFVHCSLWVNFN